jgi:hypothetical protein
VVRDERVHHDGHGCLEERAAVSNCAFGSVCIAQQKEGATAGNAAGRGFGRKQIEGSKVLLHAAAAHAREPARSALAYASPLRFLLCSRPLTAKLCRAFKALQNLPSCKDKPRCPAPRGERHVSSSAAFKCAGERGLPSALRNTTSVHVRAPRDSHSAPRLRASPTEGCLPAQAT